METRKERLNHLIKVLEDVEKKAKPFYMGAWSTWDDNEHELEQMLEEPEKCGYAGCAMGWACLDKEFNALGLYLDHDADPTYKYPKDKEPDAMRRYEGDFTVYGFLAGQKFFHITPLESSFLFDPSYYTTNGSLSDCEHHIPNYEEAEKLLIPVIEGVTIYDVEDSVTPRQVIEHIKFILENPFTDG